MFKPVVILNTASLKSKQMIIRSNEALKKEGLLVKTPLDFEHETLFGFIYVGGSVPKRMVKDVLYDSNTKTVTLVTNLKEITMTSLDYRIQCFFYTTTVPIQTLVVI